MRAKEINISNFQNQKKTKNKAQAIVQLVLTIGTLFAPPIFSLEILYSYNSISRYLFCSSDYPNSTKNKNSIKLSNHSKEYFVGFV